MLDFSLCFWIWMVVILSATMIFSSPAFNFHSLLEPVDSKRAQERKHNQQNQAQIASLNES